MIEFADDTARINALLGGEVEPSSTCRPAKASRSGATRTCVLQSPTGAWQPFTMRIDETPFDDVRTCDRRSGSSPTASR